MKKLRIYFLISALVLAPFSAANATGFPTVDITAIAKDIVSWVKQAKDMYDQYTQLQKQYKQAKQAYDSINGVRDMAKLVNNPETRHYVPDEYQDVMKLGLDIAGGDYDDLQNSVKTYRLADKVIDISETHLEPDSKGGKAFTDAQQKNAINNALAEKAYDETNKRTENIQVLMDKIDSAPDDKDISDLTARIAAEEAMLINESNKLAALDQANVAFWETRKQQGREMQRASLGSPDFSYRNW